MLFRLLCVVGLGLYAASPACAVDAKDLAGKYTIKGATADGKNRYEQTATIAHKQGNVLELTLKDGKQTWIGVGKLNGDMVKFTVEKASGKGRTDTWEYQVRKNGNLVAEWKDGNKMWKETWVKDR
jgi:hypothetical protein